MTTSTTRSIPSIAGCSITLLDMAACNAYLAWLTGKEGGKPEVYEEKLCWALAHCDGGVTWGRLDKDGLHWHLGSDVVPKVSPPIRRQTLQELRLFGECSEVLMWRTAEGLRGRILRDVDLEGGQLDENDPLRPSEEWRILRGDSVRDGGEPGFTRLVDGTGAEQVVAGEFTTKQVKSGPVRLHVRHYWQQDTDNGAARIAATRLVALGSEDSDDTD